MRHPILAAGAGLLLVAITAASARADKSALKPTRDAMLFISPMGEPFRSKPKEPYPLVAWFLQADTNKDGRLDAAEFRADAERFFRKLDVNGDGIVDDAEISNYEKVIAPEINGGVLDPSAGLDAKDANGNNIKVKEDADTYQGAAAYALLNDPEPVRSADRQLSGRIALADFLARADHNFSALDEAGRGYLTIETLPGTPAEHPAPGQ
jgi:hypothetical protein